MSDLPHGGKLKFITDEDQTVAHVTAVKEEVGRHRMRQRRTRQQRLPSLKSSRRASWRPGRGLPGPEKAPPEKK